MTDLFHNWTVTSIQFSSVQSLSHVQFLVTPWTTACQASLSITTPGVYPNSCPLTQWCHPTISSSVIPFSFCPQSLPASGSFTMSQLFAWGGQSIGVSVSISPSKEHPGLTSFRMDWLDPLAVQGTQESSPTTQFKSINSLMLSFLRSPTLTYIHDHWKNHSLD